MNTENHSEKSAAAARIDLNSLSEEDILALRICDLPVTIEGTWLEDCIRELYSELVAKGISYQPACYLADEWLTPEHEPVIGVPFYLAHPALLKLEKKMMLEAEGETRDWCLKLLRHEAGHALCYAYALNRKRKWKQVFGSSAQEYGDNYRFRPYSRNFVRHLEGFYAQYHPDEDFVETFAVWLTPDSRWQEKYRGWPVLKKLHYVDELMKGIQGQPPVQKKGKQFWHIRTIKATLRHCYEKKRRLRAEDFPDFHDGNLLKIFVRRDETNKDLPGAADLIAKYRKDILNDVALWTGEKKYVVNDLLKTVIKRCQELKLAAPAPDPAMVLRTTAYLTTLVMNYLYTGWFRGDKQRRRK